MTNHNTIRFHCRVSSDPSAPSTVIWHLQRNGSRERLPLAQDGTSHDITTREHIMTTALTPVTSLAQDDISQNITTEEHVTTALILVSLDFTSDRPPEATFGNREHSTYETEVIAVPTSDAATSIVSTSLETRISIAGTEEQETDVASTQSVDISSQFADHTTLFYSSNTPMSSTSSYILTTILLFPPPPGERRKRSANIQSSVLSIANGTLIIDIGANNTDAWKSVEGDYICVGNGAHGRDEKKLLIRLRGELIIHRSSLYLIGQLLSFVVINF